MNDTKSFWIILVVLVILIVGGYFAWTNMVAPPDGVACTMEAMMCPDGSYVGRQGPNCEFAACPGE